MTNALPQIYFRGIKADSQFNYRDPLGACWEVGFKVSSSLSEVTIFISRLTRVKRPRGSGTTLVSSEDPVPDIAIRMNYDIESFVHSKIFVEI